MIERVQGHESPVPGQVRQGQRVDNDVDPMGGFSFMATSARSGGVIRWHEKG